METTENVSTWHPLHNPECTNCKGLSRPVRAKRKCTCKPIQLELSQLLRVRKQLKSVVFRAEIPQETLAEKILGMSAPKMWRMLTGKSPISETTANQLKAITFIERKGQHVHVIYDIGPPSQRWGFMLHQRRRKTLHMQGVM